MRHKNRNYLNSAVRLQLHWSHLFKPCRGSFTPFVLLHHIHPVICGPTLIYHKTIAPCGREDMSRSQYTRHTGGNEGVAGVSSATLITASGLQSSVHDSIMDYACVQGTAVEVSQGQYVATKLIHTLLVAVFVDGVTMVKADQMPSSWVRTPWKISTLGWTHTLSNNVLSTTP